MSLTQEALNVLKGACTQQGLAATSSAATKDNYQLIWARDSVMGGIAGLLHNDAQVERAFYNSLVTLKKFQHPWGMIPSNVSASGEVSYGRLVGRVDATTWYLCGIALYGMLSGKEEDVRRDFEESVERCFTLLDAWEYNSKGLLYTPMSGNWADEYVVQGYVLYDQCLRLWALALCGKLWQREDWIVKAKNLRSLLIAFYQFSPDTQPIHSVGYAFIKELPYWACSFGAFGYDARFDMSGNALACMLLDDAKSLQTLSYVTNWSAEKGSWLLPVFDPVIKEGDEDWHNLKHNYSFSFKNKPHHFHNGGIWPIFLGWLGVAYAMRGQQENTTNIFSDVEKYMTSYPQFYEYITADTLQPGGTAKLCFSAASILLLDAFADKQRVKEAFLFDISFLTDER